MKRNSFLPFIFPSLLGVLIFYCIPFILSFYYTLIDNMGQRHFVGLGNFHDILQNEMFLKGLKNQGTFIAIAVPIGLVLALFFALQLRKVYKGQRHILLIALIPFVVPSGSIVYFWECIFNRNGLLNKVLYSLNISMINWYNSKWVMLIAVIIFLWKNIGIITLLFYLGVNQIPKEYYEISEIEGINRFQRFSKITLVYLAPIIFIAILFFIISSFKIFKEIYLLFGNYPNENIYMLQHYMNNQFFSLNLQKLTTASFVLFIILGLLIGLIFQLQKKYSDSFNTLNFQQQHRVVSSRKSIYFARGFSIIVVIFLLMPLVWIITNSYMVDIEIINRYTTNITPYNIEDIATSSMHFVRMGRIPDQPTISQYIEVLLKSPRYLRLYWNSIIIIVPILIGQCIFSPMAAYAFEQSKFKYKEILFFVYIVIMLMPLQVLLVPNYLMASWLGFVNSYWAIILPAIFHPIGVFIIRLQLKGFPKECIESAQNCGATHFQVFINIVLPNIKAKIGLLMVVLFAEYWNVIDQAIVFIKAPYSQPLSIYLSQVAENDLGIFFASSVLYLIPISLLFFTIGQHMRKIDIKD